MDTVQTFAITVGRDLDNALRLTDPSVSGKHAIISIVAGRLHIIDLQSSNGTFVNGEAVSAVFVSPNDQVLLGVASLPWDHVALRPLLVETGSSLAVSPALPDPPVPARSAKPLIALAAAAMLTILGGLAFFLLAPSTGQRETSASRAPLPAPAIRADVPDLSNPIASQIFSERLADQVDLRRQEERVRNLRFRIQSQVNVDGFLFFNKAKHPRESWAVPLGIVERDHARHLAVGTTRCIVDYEYPQERMHRDRGNFRNLALFTGLTADAVRDPQVFRVTEPPGLAGSRYWSGREGLLNRYPDLAGRYFGELRTRYGVHAELVEGDWNTNSGVDFVILYFPLSDPGTASLEPRPQRTLQMRDPMARMQEALGGRTNLWGDTFQFSLVSQECMAAMSRELQQTEHDFRMLQTFAVATAVVLVGVVTGGASTAAFASLKAGVGQILTSRALRTAGRAALGGAWRTLVRHLNGENLREVVWDESGRLVVHFLRPNGEIEETAIAGLTNAGLSASAAQSVAAGVRNLVQTGGDFTVPTMRRDGVEVGAIMNADARIDVAAELISRGIVQLDTTNQQFLAQQPGLVQAARNAQLASTQPSTSPISDPSYQARLRALR